MKAGMTEVSDAVPMPEGEESPQSKYNLKYYDTCGLFRFIFIDWPRSWMNYLTKEYVDIDELHPLPKADEISYWQPIFSKHVSDGLLQLEQADYDDANPDKTNKATKRHNHVILRALLKTFWVRCVILVLGHLIMHMISVGTSLLLKHLLVLMGNDNRTLSSIIGMIMVIVGVEFFNSVLSQHLFLFFNRVHISMESVLTVTLFQHGMSHRRAYAAAIGNCTVMSSCKGIVHKWPCNNEDCGADPLRCPARRHQNNELPPNMYVYLFVDSYAVIRIIDAMVEVTKFLCTFIMSMLIIRNSIGMDVLVTASIVISIVMAMVVIEATNGYVWLQTLRSKDRMVSRTSEVLSNLNVLKVMGMEDIGYNIAQDSRDDEIMVLKTRTGLHSTSIFLNRIIGVSVLLFVLLDYIRSMKASINDSNFDIATPITVMFIVEKITAASENLPKTMKTIVEFATSLTRVERFMRTCSPNFYLKPPADSTPTVQFDTAKMGENKEGISEDTLVQFKKASFTWINNRRDLVDVKKDKTPMFTGLDFELKRGDFKIITGSQGCGKTSFIKSILGEMSLVSGSMAVAPLSTGMPIFYTSQEIWLPADNIRSIITFGYAYNEEVYNEVVRCAELVTDFSAWEDGDLRVISDKGYSLSGGQRVRISLARALYAYMIFSKANETMENNRCCFLMCLDEPFNGLDVSVATAIFNNLFNKDTGLLVRDDIAVVMAMSKMSMDVCLTDADYKSLVSLMIHNIDKHRLSDAVAAVPSSVSNVPVVTSMTTFKTLEKPLRKSNSLFRLPKYLWRSCEDSGLNLKKERHSIDQRFKKLDTNYEDDFTTQRSLCSTKDAYKTYFAATGNILMMVIVVFMVGAIVVEKVNAVWVAKWSDSIKGWANPKNANELKPDTILIENSRISSYITIFSSCYMVFTFCCVFLNAVAAISGPIRLHRFAENSFFFKSSAVISLKKSIGKIGTFLSTDLSYIDYFLIYFTYSTIFAILKLVMLFATVCYTIPISSPIPIIGALAIYFLLYKRYIASSKKGQLLMIEGVSYINTVYANVIEGSAMYRSYQKENQCMGSIYERSDYCYRSKFMKASFTARFMIETKLITCFVLFCIAILPILDSYFRGTPLRVGQVGLGISLAMAINGSLGYALFFFTTLEKCMCSMARYERYFLQGKFHLKEKFDSMNESILSIFGSQEERDKVDKKRVGDLVKRRKVEFRNFMFRRYRSLLSTLFYKPKIDVLDISAYLPADHTTLSLDNVCVPQPNQTNQDGARYILSDVSAKAFAGDVIGIVGRTGAGKSTLLSVLQNISRRREGSVLLDGRELNDIPRSILRHIIGVLPQIPFVFKGWTLRRFLDPRMLYTDEEIHNALECCGLLELVKSLPDGKGLDAVLTPEDVTVQSGLYLVTPLIRIKKPHDDNVIVRQDIENGNNSHIPETCFSMGQLRMLSFARLVLYRDNYRILLIDEPPSDNIVSNEQAKEPNDVTNKEPDDGILPIYNLVKIYFKHCTTFIVAHDKNVLNYCTIEWHMKDGRLISKIPLNATSTGKED